MRPTTATLSYPVRHRASGAVDRQRRQWRTAIPAAACSVVVCWALAWAGYALHVAWLLPILIVAAAASLLRAGTGLFDRLVPAIAALVGALCVGGLVFSVWPWGLHPVPVAGTALTTLIATALLTGRRPMLPRPSLADGLSLANGVLAGLIVAWPAIAADPTRRLAVAAGEVDLGRQFALFDAVRHVGGYLYGEPALFSGLLAYPPGAPLVFGTLDGFLRSSAGDYGTGPNALQHYLGWLGAGYALFGIVLTWGAQRLAATALTPARRVILVGVMAVTLLMTAEFRFAVSGNLGEILGFAVILVLAVVLCRPAGSSAETLIVSGALLTAVGFVFPTVLLPGLLAVGIWVTRRWAQVHRHPAALAVLTVAAGAGVVAAVVGATHARDVPAVSGTRAEGGKAAFLIVLVAFLAGLLLRAAAQSAVWRSYAWFTGAVGASLVVIDVAERLSGAAPDPGTQYYYVAGVVLDLALCVAVLGLGSLLWLLPAGTRTRIPSVGVRVAVVGSAALMMVAALGIVLGDTPANRAVTNRLTVAPWQFVHGQLGGSVASMVLAAQTLTVAGATTVVLDDDQVAAQRAQALVAALERSTGTLAPEIYQRLDLAASDDAVIDRQSAVLAQVTGPVVLVVGHGARAGVWAASIQTRLGARIASVVPVAG